MFGCCSGTLRQSQVKQVETTVTHQLMENVVMSNMLEKGPKQIMNRMIDQALHAFGRSRYSGSTLSLPRISFPSDGRRKITNQGIDAWEKS